jgi:hypothetical protein
VPNSLVLELRVSQAICFFYCHSHYIKVLIGYKEEIRNVNTNRSFDGINENLDLGYV